MIKTIFKLNNKAIADPIAPKRNKFAHPAAIIFDKDAHLGGRTTNIRPKNIDFIVYSQNCSFGYET